MEWIKIVISAGGLLVGILGLDNREAEEAAKRAEEAARRADIWFNWFCIAVIVIAVLAFIIWRKHRNSAQTIEESEER